MPSAQKTQNPLSPTQLPAAQFARPSLSPPRPNARARASAEAQLRPLGLPLGPATPPLGPVPPRRPASQGPRVSPHPASPLSHPHRLTTRAHMAARSLPRSNGTAGAAEISGRNPRRDHDGRAPRSPAPPINPRGTPPTSTLPRSTAPIPSRLATQLRRAEQRAAPPRPRRSATPEARPSRAGPSPWDQRRPRAHCFPLRPRLRPRHRAPVNRHLCAPPGLHRRPLRAASSTNYSPSELCPVALFLLGRIP